MLQWKLRRLAARVLRVLERHADTDPSLGTFTQTLLPATEQFMETYDAVRLMATTADQELAQGKQAVDAVGRKLVSYSAQIEATGAIERFKRTDYDGTSKVPDDVITDAEAFIEVVRKQVEKDPESLPMGQTVIDDMTTLVETAKKEWSEADGIKSQYRTLVEQNRKNAKAFSGLLIAFRRALSSTLGRSHPDYQTLRASKVDRAMLEEGEEEGLPEHLLPATPERNDGDQDPELAKAG